MLDPLHLVNFQTLCRAFAAGDVALVELEHTPDNSVVAGICTVEHVAGEVHLTPFAILLDDTSFPCVRLASTEGQIYGVDRI